MVGEDLGDIYRAQGGLLPATPADSRQALLGGEETIRWRIASATTSTSWTANRSKASRAVLSSTAITPMQTGTHAHPGNIVRPEARVREFTAALLEVELAGDHIDLPSFPEVALRVRRALADEDVSIDQVVRMVSAEPSLVVRLLQLGNSAALNPSGAALTTCAPRSRASASTWRAAPPSPLPCRSCGARKRTRASKSRSTSSGATAPRWRR